MRFSAAAVLLVAAVAAGLVAGPAQAAPPTYGPAAAAYVQLQTTRQALADKAPGFADPYVRQYIGTAVAKMDDALLPFRWGSTGLALNGSGQPALYSLREATAWLVWADAGLRDATVSDQRNIVWALGEIARARYNEVSRFIGEGGGPNPWALFASGYFLNEGDALLASDIMHASLAYISSWEYLIGQPPCC